MSHEELPNDLGFDIHNLDDQRSRPYGLSRTRRHNLRLNLENAPKMYYGEAYNEQQDQKASRGKRKKISVTHVIFEGPDPEDKAKESENGSQSTEGYDEIIAAFLDAAAEIIYDDPENDPEPSDRE